MKVAFAGASGTGKSTLARWVAETYNLPFNPVGSRSVAKSMGFVGEDGEGRPYDVDQATAWAYDASLHTGPKEAARAAKDAYARRSKAEGRRPGASCTMRPVFQRRLADEKIAWEQAHADFVTDRTPLDDLVYALMHCREIVDAPSSSARSSTRATVACSTAHVARSRRLTRTPPAWLTQRTTCSLTCSSSRSCGCTARLGSAW